MANIAQIAQDILELETILRRDYTLSAEYRREVVTAVFKGAYKG